MISAMKIISGFVREFTGRVSVVKVPWHVFEAIQSLVSNELYAIRPLKWTKTFDGEGQQYLAVTVVGDFYVERWKDEATGKYNEWQYFADVVVGSYSVESVKTANEGKQRCEEIYRKIVKTMLVSLKK